MNLTKENFPAEIRKIRRENNWTVRDMAKSIGMSPRTIEGWEQGRRIPINGIALVNLFTRPHQ